MKADKLIVLLAGCLLPGAAAAGGGAEPPKLPPGIMTAAALGAFPSPPADATIAYGSDPLQFGELRLPDGDGPFPVMVLIHGGCWRAKYDLSYIRKLAAAFTAAGIATWTVEYRRVGDPGGGWPGTYEDIVAGSDHLRSLGRRYPLDLERVIVAGHSAGGQMALWYASRPAAMRGPDAIDPTGVLALTPATDLAHLYQQGVCENIIGRLMGGSPEQWPERYAQGSLFERPSRTPQIVIVGVFDTQWRRSGLRYARHAARAGAPLRLFEAGASGHFEVIDPDSSTWPLVRRAARGLLGME